MAKHFHNSSAVIVVMYEAINRDYSNQCKWVFTFYIIPQDWQDIGKLICFRLTLEMVWWATCVIFLGLVRPSDAIWRHWYGSTLAQVIACCLTTPSHYLSQCWHITSKVRSSYIHLTRWYISHQSLNLVRKLLIKILFQSPRGQWVNILDNTDHVIMVLHCADSHLLGIFHFCHSHILPKFPLHESLQWLRVIWPLSFKHLILESHIQALAILYALPWKGTKMDEIPGD